MIFSSTVFMFQFLPCCLLVYYGTWWISRRLQYANIALVLVSLTFYFIGSGWLVLLLLGSIGANYFLGRAIAASEGRRKQAYLIAGVVIDLGLLMYFKYASFFLQSIASVASAVGWHFAAPVLEIALPVGISFYTFMSISYLVQVYSKLEPARTLADYAVYMSLFPHLVAGPIVRFSELRDEIVERRIDSDMFLDGIFRFSIGLVRKVVIADSLAAGADRIFALPASDLTPLLAWTGALCYAFQIFYDFSGYTDMAIGLAKMLGFHFPENFNQPYTASNLTDFWRRWHMTLTRWFRDYLYIPLGGNRKGTIRTYCNLFIVFVLCGLWHGAAWTFAAWGIYHGILLVIERVLDRNFAFRMSGPAGVIATFLLVTIGWIFFRSATIGGALGYIAAMFGHASSNLSLSTSIALYLPLSTICYLLIAAAFAFCPSGIQEHFSRGLRLNVAKGTFASSALLLSVAYVSETTFRPFIYFRF